MDAHKLRGFIVSPIIFKLKLTIKTGILDRSKFSQLASDPPAWHPSLRETVQPPGFRVKDTLYNEVPFIFRKDQIYASVVFAGCGFSFLVAHLFDHRGIVMASGAVAIVVLRSLVRVDIRLQRDSLTLL